MKSREDYSPYNIWSTLQLYPGYKRFCDHQWKLSSVMKARQNKRQGEITPTVPKAKKPATQQSRIVVVLWWTKGRPLHQCQKQWKHCYQRSRYVRPSCYTKGRQLTKEWRGPLPLVLLFPPLFPPPPPPPPSKWGEVELCCVWALCCHWFAEPEKINNNHMKVSHV